MADGFIFNPNWCVACGACSAACVLENSWTFRPRIIYTYNDAALPSLPVINISLACNHCDKAVCIEGCPSSSFYRDAATGAILIDDKKCIGCRYCQWNCPYDAPKFILPEQVIGKCNLCYQRLSAGFNPACSTACPTGALEYGSLNGTNTGNSIPWFPDKDLKPAIKLTGTQSLPLAIYPQSAFDEEASPAILKGVSVREEWSLIAFSFLTILSVAKLLTALIAGNYPEKFQFLSIIFMAGAFSIFHLGKKVRAWRAVGNLRHSPLSREIVLFILYAILASAAVIIRIPAFLLLSSLTGLMLMISIDAVYLFAEKWKSVWLHSGQSFITALLIASFFTGIILPFIFIAAIKLAVSLWHASKERDDRSLFVIRFFRSALLILTGISMITKISYPETAVIYLFLAGELIDRTLFYFDFKPLNINRLINS